MYQRMMPLVNKFLRINRLIVSMVVNQRAEAHTKYTVVFSNKTYKNAEAHWQPLMHSNNKEVDTKYLETQHYTRIMIGTKNDFQI